MSVLPTPGYDRGADDLAAMRDFDAATNSLIVVGGVSERVDRVNIHVDGGDTTEARILPLPAELDSPYLAFVAELTGTPSGTVQAYGPDGEPLGWLPPSGTITAYGSEGEVIAQLPLSGPPPPSQEPTVSPGDGG